MGLLTRNAIDGLLKGSDATVQRALQKFKTILAPEDFAARQHIGRCTEHAARQTFFGIPVPNAIEFGVGRRGSLDRLQIEPRTFCGVR